MLAGEGDRAPGVSVPSAMTGRSTTPIVIALGTAQTVSWASTYYLPGVLATPMARDLGISTMMVFAPFSAAMVISAIVGAWAGVMIDRHGGRGILIASNIVFAIGLTCMAMAQGPVMLWLGWLIVGFGMGFGLYEAAFSALTCIFGRAARSPITGITLIAGFASTVGWPLSALIEANYGWRVACLVWAGLQLCLALPLNAFLPAGNLVAAEAAKAPPSPETKGETVASRPGRTRLTMVLLAFVFTVTWFSATAMAAHLPRLLEAAGASTAVAVGAGALIGPAQVGARLFEFTVLRHFHPLVSARLATLTHPVGAGLLLWLGAPASYLFTVLHGAGNGVLTIAKGTLPLALFGPAGYGTTQGLIMGPGRALQAAAPLLFGYALERYGANAIWLTAGLSFSAFLALMFVQAGARRDRGR